MSRFLPFTKVKCDWFHMRIIVLTVKKNNCKTPSPEAVSRFEKIVH